MEVFDVEQRDIHGGSMRVFVARTGKMTVTPNVGLMLEGEVSAELHSERVLRQFAADVRQNRQMLTDLLHKLRSSGKSIVAVSAPAKGMTLLNYCRIGAEMVDYVTEKSQLKVGRFTPGTHIPVVADAELSSRPADYALLLAWNFADEIMNNLKFHSDAGGKFIVPIPSPRIVG